MDVQDGGSEGDLGSEPDSEPTEYDSEDVAGASAERRGQKSGKWAGAGRGVGEGEGGRGNGSGRGGTESQRGRGGGGCRGGTEGGMRAEAYEGGSDLLRGRRAEHVKGLPGAKRQSVFLYATLPGDPYWRTA